jgi:uncharacterized cupin superfamily protein
VLDGEVVLVLDDSETALRAGDVVVQRGTVHRWENRTERPAQMAFVLVDGAFTADLLGTLHSGVLDGLLHDPMHPPAHDHTHPAHDPAQDHVHPPAHDPEHPPSRDPGQPPRR